MPYHPHHVVARGVNRSAVFFGADDYRLYLRVLREAAEKHGCSVHAYVLMTNHVHLLVTPRSEEAIPLVSQSLGRKYVQAINRRYCRTGTLWEGRYRVSVVDSAAYLLACYRYIELNPVRAGMCPKPDLYPYSSYHFNAVGQCDPVVTPHEEYLALAEKPEARLRNYRQMFGNKMGASELRAIREAVNACGVLGDDCFKDRVEALLGYSVRPGRAGRPRKSAPAR